MATKDEYVGNWTIVDAKNPATGRVFARVGSKIRISGNEADGLTCDADDEFCSPGIEWSALKPQYIPEKGGSPGSVDMAGLLTTDDPAESYQIHIHALGRRATGKRQIHCEIHGVRPGETLANLQGGGSWTGDDD